MWRLAKSLSTLRTQYNAQYPNRSKVSDGTIGDAAHAKEQSEHNPNADGVVTAMDITHDPANGADMDKLKFHLIKDPRTWYVIFNSWIWEAGAWKVYKGDNPHDKHLHISVKQNAIAYDNNSNWNLGEDKMTRDQVKKAFLSVLHKTATEADLKAWTTVSYERFIDEALKNNEWLTQNHILKVAYPEAVKKLAAGTGEYVQVTEPLYRKK